MSELTGEILSVSPLTGTVYAVSEWEVVGGGKIVAKQKRALKREAIDPDRIHGPARRAYEVLGQ